MSTAAPPLVLRGLLTYAFDVWRVLRVALKTDERNAASRRAIERLGARFEGVRRADMPGQDGSVRRSAYYSIVQAEWPAVRKTLEDACGRSQGFATAFMGPRSYGRPERGGLY